MGDKSPWGRHSNISIEECLGHQRPAQVVAALAVAFDKAKLDTPRDQLMNWLTATDKSESTSSTMMFSVWWLA